MARRAAGDEFAAATAGVNNLTTAVGNVGTDGVVCVASTHVRVVHSRILNTRATWRTCI